MYTKSENHLSPILIKVSTYKFRVSLPSTYLTCNSCTIVHILFPLLLSYLHFPYLYYFIPDPLFFSLTLFKCYYIVHRGFFFFGLGTWCLDFSTTLCTNTQYMSRVCTMNVYVCIIGRLKLKLKVKARLKSEGES